MKTLWCWRCRREVAMLEPSEHARVLELYHAALRSLKIPKQGVTPDSAAVMRQQLAPVRELYASFTGLPDADAHAILQHALALYGPQCGVCGKPLRTPRAALCAACGAPRERIF